MRIDSIQLSPTTPTKAQADASNGLETAFLSEMLKYSGPQPTQGEFSGGVGESQFFSMLTDIYAEELSKKLDLGLTIQTGGE
ncbi:MAG: hypothetical protein KBG72_08670 [Agrobacterium sp.]|nr:hypothetical protein [Agrobacterium sp.]